LRIAEGNTKRMQNELKTTTGTVMTVHVQEGATAERGLRSWWRRPIPTLDRAKKIERMKKFSGFQSDYR